MPRKTKTVRFTVPNTDLEYEVELPVPEPEMKNPWVEEEKSTQDVNRAMGAMGLVAPPAISPGRLLSGLTAMIPGLGAKNPASMALGAGTAMAGYNPETGPMQKRDLATQGAGGILELLKLAPPVRNIANASPLLSAAVQGGLEQATGAKAVGEDPSKAALIGAAGTTAVGGAGKSLQYAANLAPKFLQSRLSSTLKPYFPGSAPTGNEGQDLRSVAKAIQNQEELETKIPVLQGQKQYRVDSATEEASQARQKLLESKAELDEVRATYGQLKDDFTSTDKALLAKRIELRNLQSARDQNLADLDNQIIDLQGSLQQTKLPGEKAQVQAHIRDLQKQRNAIAATRFPQEDELADLQMKRQDLHTTLTARENAVREVATRQRADESSARAANTLLKRYQRNLDEFVNQTGSMRQKIQQVTDKLGFGLDELTGSEKEMVKLLGKNSEKLPEYLLQKAFAGDDKFPVDASYEKIKTLFKVSPESRDRLRDQLVRDIFNRTTQGPQGIGGFEQGIKNIGPLTTKEIFGSERAYKALVDLGASFERLAQIGAVKGNPSTSVGPGGVWFREPMGVLKKTWFVPWQGLGKMITANPYIATALRQAAEDPEQSRLGLTFSRELLNWLDKHGQRVEEGSAQGAPAGLR